MSQYVTMTTICTWWFWHLLLWHWSCQPTASVLAWPWASDKRLTKAKTFGKSIETRNTRETSFSKRIVVEAFEAQVMTATTERTGRCQLQHLRIAVCGAFVSLTMLSNVIFSCNIHCNYTYYDVTSSYFTYSFLHCFWLHVIWCNLQIASPYHWSFIFRRSPLSSLLLKGNQVLAPCRSLWDLNLLELILNCVLRQRIYKCSKLTRLFLSAPWHQIWSTSIDHTCNEVFFRPLSIAGFGHEGFSHCLEELQESLKSRGLGRLVGCHWPHWPHRAIPRSSISMSFELQEMKTKL